MIYVVKVTSETGVVEIEKTFDSLTVAMESYFKLLWDNPLKKTTITEEGDLK